MSFGAGERLLETGNGHISGPEIVLVRRKVTFNAEGSHQCRHHRSKSTDIPTDELRSQLDGELITPNDSAYDEARHVFFKGIDRRPLAVARVAGAADVARVVTAARETGLDLAVRSGGHSRAGLRDHPRAASSSTSPA